MSPEIHVAGADFGGLEGEPAGALRSPGGLSARLRSVISRTYPYQTVPPSGCGKGLL